MKPRHDVALLLVGWYPIGKKQVVRPKFLAPFYGSLIVPRMFDAACFLIVS